MEPGGRRLLHAALSREAAPAVRAEPGSVPGEPQGKSAALEGFDEGRSALCPASPRKSQPPRAAAGLDRGGAGPEQFRGPSRKGFHDTPQQQHLTVGCSGEPAAGHFPWLSCHNRACGFASCLGPTERCRTPALPYGALCKHGAERGPGGRAGTASGGAKPRGRRTGTRSELSPGTTVNAPSRCAPALYRHSPHRTVLRRGAPVTAAGRPRVQFPLCQLRLREKD